MLRTYTITIWFGKMVMQCWHFSFLICIKERKFAGKSSFHTCLRRAVCHPISTCLANMHVVASALFSDFETHKFLSSSSCHRCAAIAAFFLSLSLPLSMALARSFSCSFNFRCASISFTLCVWENCEDELCDYTFVVILVPFTCRQQRCDDDDDNGDYLFTIAAHYICAVAWILQCVELNLSC